MKPRNKVYSDKNWNGIRMTKILFTNTNCSWNKGSASQVISASTILRRFISDTKFTLMSYCSELDSEKCSAYDIKVVGFGGKIPRERVLPRLSCYILPLFRCGLWAVLQKIGLNTNSLINGKVLREYAQADLIIDLSGDSFSDTHERFPGSIINILILLIGILLGKPIVIFSQSIGPFKTITMPLAKFCLNKTDLIIVREGVTKRYLKRIGVNRPPIFLTADTAFFLEPAPHEIVRSILSKERIRKNNEPLVGISASKQIDKIFEQKKLPGSNNKYVTLMAQAVDYLIEKLNARVVFVPHIVSEGGYDDRFEAKKICRLVRNKDRIKLIENDYTPEELRGVIGNFDLFIGARMHANISAISMHVPTIAIAWSHKYYGIMKTLGQEKYVCDIKTTTSDELISKINDAWAHREEIKKTLRNKVKVQKELALFNGELVKGLLISLKKI